MLRAILSDERGKRPRRSLNDMARRAALFQELLSVFRVLSYHEAFSALLAQVSQAQMSFLPLTRRKLTKGLWTTTPTKS